MEFIKDKNVASAVPSFSFAVKHLCKNINFSTKKIIIEYGPGTGVFTKYLLKKLSSESKLIVIESNNNLANYLKEIDDKRLIVVNDSVLNIKEILKDIKIEKADYVISGIPFSFLDIIQRDNLLKNTKKILDKNGKFFVYQVKKSIENDLKNYFKIISKKFEIRNIPPLYIFECRKR